MYYESFAPHLKGSIDVPRMIGISSSSSFFSIKEKSRLRKCHLFWTWDWEFKVFFLSSSLCVSLRIFKQSFLRLFCLFWSLRCDASAMVLITRDWRSCKNVASKTVALLVSSRVIGVTVTAGFSMNSALSMQWNSIVKNTRVSLRMWIFFKSTLH